MYVIVHYEYEGILSMTVIDSYLGLNGIEALVNLINNDY